MNEGARTPLLAMVLSLLALALPALGRDAARVDGPSTMVQSPAAPPQPPAAPPAPSKPPDTSGDAERCLAASCPDGDCTAKDSCEGRFFGFLSRQAPRAGTSNSVADSDAPDEPACGRFAPASTVNVVALLPDPLDTGMRASFDDGLDALLRSLETQGYCRGSFWSPWHDASPRGGGEDGTAECASKVPAAFTFHDCRGMGARPPVNLFIVGESPTSGVRPGAVRLALALARAHRPPNISILGPTFSGSVDSLEAAMGPPAPSGEPPRYTVATGSASVARVRDKLASRGDTDYRAYVLSSEVVRQGFFTYLLSTNLKGTAFHRESGGSRRAPWLEHVALFTEEGTSYGNAIQVGVAQSRQGVPAAPANLPAGFTGSPCTPSSPCDASINVKFPLHVSSLRTSFSSELAPSAPAAESIGPVAPRQLELKLRVDTFERRDTPPALSLQTGIAEDLTLAEQTRVLEEENIRVVGIFASDPVDALFIVRRLRERLPNARLFVFEHDALFQHPDHQAALRGVVLVSSYPPTARVDRWVFPFSESERRLFTSPYGTALFNAVLLGTPALPEVGTPREDLTLAYGAPFVVPERHGLLSTPSLWFTAMGAAGAVPLAALSDVADDYTTPVPRSVTTRTLREVDSLGPNVFPGPGFRAGVTAILSLLLVLALGAQQGMSSPAGLFLGLRWGSVFRPPLLLTTDRQWQWSGAALATILVYCAAAMLVGGLVQPLFFVSMPPSIALHLPPMDYLAFVHVALLVVTLGLTLRSVYQIVNDTTGSRRAGQVAALAGLSLAIGSWVVLGRHVLVGWARTEPASFALTYTRWTSLGTQLSPVLPVLLLLGVFLLLGFQYLTEAQAGAGHSPASVRRVFDFAPFEVSGRDPALFGVGRLTQMQVILFQHTFLSRTPSVAGAAIAALFILVAMGDGLGGFDTLETPPVSLAIAVLLATAQMVTAGAIGRMVVFVSAALILLVRLRLHPLADRVVEKQGQLPVDTDLAFARLPSTPELLRVWLECSAKLAALLPEGDPWRNTKDPGPLDRMRAAALQGDLVAGLSEGLGSRPALPESLLPALQNHWQKTDCDLPAHEEARNLAAVYVLLFLHWMIRVFRRKVAFPMAASLLVTLAVSVYPFEPARELATLAAVFFVITLFVSFTAFVALERDPFLRRLAGGAQNRVQWTWSLVRHVGSWVVLPLLAFLATQYPDRARDLFAWVKPILGAG